jgi:rhamnose transport system substrate-binding protein
LRKEDYETSLLNFSQILKKGETMKNILRVLLLLALVSGAVLGCSPQETEEPEAPVVEEPEAENNSTNDLRIAFIPMSLGVPYFTAMENGGLAAAEEMGGEFLFVGSPEGGPAEQVRLMESLIEQQVDAISVAVTDATTLQPVIERGLEAGVKMYTSDSDAPESERLVFVAQAQSKDLGYVLIDELVKQFDADGQIGIVSGAATMTNMNQWISFMEERVAQEYPNVEIVDIRYTTGAEDALVQAEELMTRFPEIKGLVAVASSTVPGVAQAVQQAGRAGEVAVIGYGSPNTVRDFVKSGVMKTSILWDAWKLGWLTHWAGLQMAQGIPFEAENEVPGFDYPVQYFEDTKILLLGPPLVIDINNVDDFDF